MMLIAPLILFLWVAVTTCAASQCNQLVAITECVCPGRSVIYECSVMGGVFTVYQGTAFQCRSGSITLRNNEFDTGNAIGVCNSDSEEITITGQGLTEENGCFKSQVNITLGEGVSQETVSCAIDGVQMELISTIDLAVSTEAYSPPSGLSFTKATPSYLTFSWDPVSLSCPSLVYSISTTNCGICPSKTSRTSINCTEFSVPLAQSGQMTCSLAIQTVICDGTSAPISGNTTTMSYTLKLPNAPSLNITPYYDMDGNLEGFHAIISLSDPDPIFMYDSVDGSARSITFKVSDGNDMNCDSATYLTITPQSCSVDGVCKHHSQKICSTTSSTNVAVYVSNVLGDGISITKRIDNQNNFVTIKFDNDHKRVQCIFLNPNPMLNGQKTCMITIGSGQNNMVTRNGSSTSEDTVSINLNGFFENVDETRISYMITASNGIHQVVVVDDLELRPPLKSASIGGIVAGVLISIIIIVLLVGLVVIIVQDRYIKNQLLLLRKEDCEVIEVKEKKKIGDIVPEQLQRVGEHFDPSSGHGYRKAKDNENLPQDVKVIAVTSRSDHELAEIFAVNGRDVARRFVNSKRQIRPANKRRIGFKGYRLFVQEQSSSVVLDQGSEFVYCSKNPVENDVFSQIHPKQKLPSGVKERKFNLSIFRKVIWKD